MPDALNQLIQSAEAFLPKLVAALVILIVGWLIAKIASAIVRGVLRRTSIDNMIAKTLFGAERAKSVDIEKGTGKAVYYILMIFVLIAFFEALGLTLLIEPLNSLLNRVFAFIPQLVGAGILLLLAWIIATLLRMLISKGLGAAKIDERLGGDEGDSVPLTKSLSEAVYWLVFLFFLPAILGALELGGLLNPVQSMLDKILGFVPNLFTAGILLLIGWFIARLVQKIVSSLLVAIGLDRLGERIGLSDVLGKATLSGLVGWICYIFIFIPVVIGALNALQLEAVAQPASAMLSQILGAIPAIFTALFLIAISYIIGHLVGGLVANILTGVGFNNILTLLGLAKEGTIGGHTPAAIVGTLVKVAIIFFAATEALGLLGFAALVDLVAFFLVFAGHVLLGLLIIGIGIYLANLVARMVKATETSNADLLALIARIAILVLAGAMGLQQMGLANEIINLAFGLLLGALTVAAAIAFGLGGRDTAAKMLENWHDAKSKKD